MSAIQVVGDQIPSFPEDFNRRLQNIDPDLYVTWHQPPFSNKAGRWKIEQCIGHHAQGNWPGGHPKHSNVCNRIYVAMAQDDEMTPLPLGDWLIDKLQKMRQYVDSLGGPTARGAENFRRESDNLDAERSAKIAHEMAEIARLNSVDNRRQWNEIWNFFSVHDPRPNK